MPSFSCGNTLHKGLCRDILRLHIVGILCVWALQGYSARIPCGWVLGYPVVDACREFLQFNTTLRVYITAAATFSQPLGRYCSKAWELLELRVSLR